MEKEILSKPDQEVLISLLVDSGRVTYYTGRAALIKEIGLDPDSIRFQDGTGRDFAILFVDHLVGTGDIRSITGIVYAITPGLPGHRNAISQICTALCIDLPFKQRFPERESPFDVLGDQSGRGLWVLDALLAEPGVWEELDPIYLQNFTDAAQNIHALHCYKQLHDEFEELITIARNIEQDSKSLLTSNQANWDQLRSWVEESQLQKRLQDVQEITSESAFDESDIRWKEGLTTAQTKLRAAVNQSNTLQLRSAVEKLIALLSWVPKSLNYRLVTKAKELHLSSLVIALHGAADILKHLDLDSHSVREIEDGIHALEKLSNTLSDLSGCHSVLQQTDTVLDLIISNLSLGGDLTIWSGGWSELQGLMKDVCRGHEAEEWAQSVDDVVEELDGLWHRRDNVSAHEVQNLLDKLHVLVSRRFPEVDYRLLQLSRVLDSSIRAPLNTIVEGQYYGAAH